MASESPIARFIVLDGPEGCGKSTQIRLLRAALVQAGVMAEAVRDPGTTRIGEQVRAILLNPSHEEMGMRAEMLLYMAARAQMMTEVIRPMLARGTTVLSDRFISSTLAYQLEGDGLTAEEIRTVGRVAVGGRLPDRTLVLDMPPAAAMARVKREKDRIELRPPAYHERVRANYLGQAKADPEGYRVVRADQPRDAVHEQILSLVADYFPSLRPVPVDMP